MINPTKLRVLKGNRRIGLSKHTRLPVVSVTPMGAEYSHQCRVVVLMPTGARRTLWAQHPNRINDPSFNLGNGSGVDKIRVSVDAWERPPERPKCIRCANANWVLIGHSCGRKD